MYRVSSKSLYTHTIHTHHSFKFALHSAHYIVQWQIGNSVDGANMGAVAGELVVLSAWLTQAVSVLRGGWWRVYGCMRDSVWGKPTTQLNSLIVAAMCALSSTLLPNCHCTFLCVLCYVNLFWVHIMWVYGDSSATL